MSKTIMLKSLKSAFYTGVLALSAVTYSILPSVNAQENEEIFLNKKSFNYKVRYQEEGKEEIKPREYRLTLVSDSDLSKVNTLKEAIKVIEEDNSYSILLAGEFSKDEMDAIKLTLEDYYNINPKLISRLEPVIIKAKKSLKGYSIQNFPDGKENLDNILWYTYDEEIDTFIKKISRKGNVDYGEGTEAVYKGTIKIPATEEEHKETLKKIEEEYKKGKKDSLDFIVTGLINQEIIDSAGSLFKDYFKSVVEEHLAHELGHLVFYENPDKFYEFNKSIRNIKGDSAGRKEGDINYLERRVEEVRAWIRKEEEELNKTIKKLSLEKEPILSDKTGKDNESTVALALKNFGEEKLKKYYKEILMESALEYMFTERIAEDISDIVTGNENYTKSKELKEMHNSKVEHEKIAIEILKNTLLRQKNKEQIKILKRELERSRKVVETPENEKPFFELGFLEGILRNLHN